MLVRVCVHVCACVCVCVSGGGIVLADKIMDQIREMEATEAASMQEAQAWMAQCQTKEKEVHASFMYVHAYVSVCTH